MCIRIYVFNFKKKQKNSKNTKKQKKLKKKREYLRKIDLKNKFAEALGKIFLDSLISDNKRLLFVWPKITFFRKLWK